MLYVSVVLYRNIGTDEAMHRPIIRGLIAVAVATAGSLALAGVASAASAVPAVSAAPRVPALSLSGGRAFASPHGGTIIFRARLSAASRSVVTVHFATRNGTAVAGKDYVPVSGTLRFPPGSLRRSVTVTLRPAALGAGGVVKEFSVVLSRPVRATLSTHAATGTILPDVYVASSGDAFQDAVINPTSTTAFLTVPAMNQVDVLNLRTGTFSRPIPVGSDPIGLDITPDGKTLFVCDAGGQTISKVNLATRRVTTITTPAGFLSPRPYSIAVMNNGHALFTTTFSGSGFGGTPYDLNLSSNEIRVVPGIGINGQVTEATPLSRSAGYSTVGAVLGGDSGGRFDVYTAATGHVTSGSLNDFISSSALNANGSVMLVDGIYVINAASGTLLGTISGQRGNSVLNAAGTTGYRLAGSSIVALNIPRFLTGPTISLPEPASGGAELAMSKNGRVLVAETGGGATIIQL